MERRKFLSSTLAASALAASVPENLMGRGANESGASDGREFYQLRRYQIARGPQTKLVDDYFRDALLPALNRLQISPVGVFNVSIGPQTPAMYVLMPCLSLDALVKVEDALAKNAEYMKTGAPFLSAPGKEPAYSRMESSLMQAFENRPRLTLPGAATAHAPRVYELRTYESPSDQDHRRKVEMMGGSEFEIFKKLGFAPVFFGDTVIGPRMPNLTYMLCFESMGERDKKWAAFQASPDWKDLSTQPKYAYEDIVSNITNTILTPTAYSQI